MGFNWMWGAIAAAGIFLIAWIVVVNSAPYRRAELEAEGREWQQKGVIQPWEKEAYIDFLNRYRRETGRDW